MQEQKMELVYKSQIEKSYRLLNEIGEKVRGSQI
jgi:hypothetical protein